MSKVIRTGFAALLFVLSGGLTTAKRIADWVGRSTFIEDAEALGPKASKMFEWLADQPSMAFYIIPLVLALVGCALLFAPNLLEWASKLQSNVPPHLKPSVETSPAAATTEQSNKFYSPTVTQSAPSLQLGLYVADIRLTFDVLEKERHSELTMRVFNGTGRVIDFTNLSGHIKFNAPNNTDPDRMGELPTPTLRAEVARSVAQLQEWHLILDQRVPAIEADKILAMLKDDIPVSFDLSGLNVGVVDHDKPQEIERLPTWHGFNCRSGFGFDRIISAAGNARGKAGLVMN